MRTLLVALALALVACAPSESLPATCSPACAAGQVCVNAQCLVPADAGADAAVDVAAVDTSPDVATQDSGTPDAAVDVAADVPSADVSSDAGADAAVDAAPVCSSVRVSCGRDVDVDLRFGIPVDGGGRLHCGACGARCEVGFGCEACMCGR